jgi:hypothetical protein
MRRFSSTTSTRSRSGPLAIGVDEATDECLTGSLLWPSDTTSITRGCQADAQGLSRLDPATRTHRPSVLSCTHRKPEGAMASSGSLNAGVAHSQSTGPGLGQSARRSLRASAVASKGCHSLHHPPALGVPITLSFRQGPWPSNSRCPQFRRGFPMVGSLRY